MDDCPLVRLVYGRKILKQFEENGKVAIHLDDWIRFFEALAFVKDGGHREIFCAFAGEYLVLSKTPFKKKSAPTQIEKAKARKTKPGPTPARKKKGARAI